MNATKIVITIILLVSLSGCCDKKDVLEKTFFSQISGYTHECPYCGGTGLEWDGAETKDGKEYVRCHSGCPIPVYWVFRGRQFVADEQADKSYKIKELYER